MLVALTPFVEQQALWEQISNPLVTDRTCPPMGPTPQRLHYTPWFTEMQTLRCPSYFGVGLPALGRTNYVAAMGDSVATARDGSLCVRSAGGCGYR